MIDAISRLHHDSFRGGVHSLDLSLDRANHLLRQASNTRHRKKEWNSEDLQSLHGSSNPLTNGYSATFFARSCAVFTYPLSRELTTIAAATLILDLLRDCCSRIEHPAFSMSTDQNLGKYPIPLASILITSALVLLWFPAGIDDAANSSPVGVPI
jgi:hypothetical protein